jgi:lipoprotein Spr/probable lipoprotein NlpC
MEKYIGIPYKFNGRDMKGIDCYGLVWLVEKEVFHKELPIFSNVSDKARDILVNDYRPLLNAQEVGVPVDGDIVLMFVYGKPVHVGVYYNDGVLHALENRGVVYEKLSSRYIKRYNRKEFYRV